MEYCVKCLHSLPDDCFFRGLVDNGQVVLDDKCQMYLGITSIPDNVKLEYEDSSGNVSKIQTIREEG